MGAGTKAGESPSANQTYYVQDTWVIGERSTR